MSDAGFQQAQNYWENANPQARLDMVTRSAGGLHPVGGMAEYAEGSGVLPWMARQGARLTGHNVQRGGTQMSPEQQRQMEGQASQWMMDEGYRRLLYPDGQRPGSGNMMGTTMPLLAGVGSGLYGLFTGNLPMMAGGLASGIYGFRNLRRHGRDLQDRNLLAMAGGHSGNVLEQEAARNRLRRAYENVQPVYGMANRVGLGRMMRKLSVDFDEIERVAAGNDNGSSTKVSGDHNAAELFNSHFNLAKMRGEIRADHGIDTRTAAMLDVMAENAAKASRVEPTGIINVGRFIKGVGEGFMDQASRSTGEFIAKQVGGLLTATPTFRNTIRRAGQGLFSGAARMGIFG